jgi:hypothetical protein
MESLRSDMQKIAAILCLIVAGAIAASASANKPAGPECTVAVNGLTNAPTNAFAVSASGLPTGGALNLRVLYTNGNVSTTPITSADGSYWDGMSAEQATYTYQFVGKVSWPSGSTNKIYATCSMQAS